MSMTETDELVTSLVLIEKGYEEVPRKVEGAMRRIDAANAKGGESVKRLNREIAGPDAYSGFSRLSNEAKRTYDTIATARSRMGSGSGGVNQGGRKVATVGHLNWLAPDRSGAASKAPAIRPRIDWSKAKGDASKFADDLKANIGDGLSSLNPLKAVGVGIGAMGAAAAATGFALMGKSADFDALVQSLNSVEGSSKKAKRALDELKVLSRAPGLGFEEAVGAYSGLRNADVDADFAKKAIKEFANANARGGGGAESFGRIMYQLKQAAGRDFLQQEDLGPINEAGVPINSLLKKRYGTGDTEELKSKGITAKQALHDIVEELAKMPRVAGGFRNEVDNLADAMKFAEVSAGDALNRAFLPMANDLAGAITELSEGGVVTSAFEQVADNIRSAFDADQNGMEGVAQTMLVAAMDFSAGVRNLMATGQGIADAWDWLTGPISSEGKEAAAKRKENEFDTSLGGDHDRNADYVARQTAYNKNHEAWKRAKEAGYKGKFNDWDTLKPAERKKWADEADKKKSVGWDESAARKPTPFEEFDLRKAYNAAYGWKPKDSKNPTFEQFVSERMKESGGQADPGVGLAQGEEKALDLLERTARASEQHLSLKRSEMDMSSYASGGGELARMGVTATELSGGGNRTERMARQIAKIIAEHSAFTVVDHSVRQARNGGRM